jgi:hypothetical protein
LPRKRLTNQEKKETYMSKNLTRKGLALGAVVALGSSLFAGTPATAAPTALYLESAFGTSFEGVLGQNFVLSGTAAGAANNDDVSYYIEGVTAANLSVVGRYTTDLSAGTGTAYSSVADADGESISSSGLILEQDTDAAAKTATIKVDTWKAGSALQFALKVNATNVTATTAVKVTPFLDDVLADGKPGANELKGTAVTINFNKASELTATPTINAIALGSNVKANVAVTKVNLEQFRATSEGAPAAQDFVNVDFTSNGSAFQSDKAPLWNTTDKVFVVDSTGTPTAGNVYGATAQFGTTDSASAALVTAKAGEVSALGAFAITKGTSYRASANSSSDVVRSGSGSVSISTTATVVTDAKKAGQIVTFKIAESGNSTLDAAATVTAGGKTLANAKTGTTEDVSVEVATDADGKATLAIAYAGIKDGNQFVVSATAAGASGSVSVSSNKTFTGQDSKAAAIVDLSGAIHSGTSVRQVAKGSALSIEYVLVDQFGQAPSGDFQIVVTENSSNANFTANVPVSAGKVTFNGTDNSTADNDYTVTATVQKKNATSGNWEAIGSGLSTTSAIQIAAVGTPSSITVTAGATTGVTRDAVSYVAGNTDVEQDTVTRTAPSNGTTLTGTVVGASGAVVDGATVTFTGANVLFKAGNVYGVGSLTVRTNASGSYGTVNVYSNKAGKQTITITSGGASKTQDITFAAVTTGGTTWTSNAPARVLPGTTVKVTGTLTDKYGNAVDVASGIKVTYTGPGFLTATPATETDADGAVSATVLLGASDTGTAAFKFTYDNGTSSDDTDDVVLTSSVAIGAAPVAAVVAGVSGGTGKFNVAVTNAAGKQVVVKVAGKFFRSFSGTAAKRTVALKAPKGKHKVTVFVGGKLVATKTITVK